MNSILDIDTLSKYFVQINLEEIEHKVFIVIVSRYRMLTISEYNVLNSRGVVPPKPTVRLPSLSQ